MTHHYHHRRRSLFGGLGRKLLLGGLGYAIYKMWNKPSQGQSRIGASRETGYRAGGASTASATPGSGARSEPGRQGSASLDQAQEANLELQANARKALDMKQATDTGPSWPQSQNAHEGMQNNPNTEIAPSGALEQEGQRPVLERSRKVR